MVVVELEDATFAVVRNAVRLALHQAVEQLRTLTEEQVLHRHYGRELEAAALNDLIAVALESVDEHHDALNTVDAHQRCSSG
ncbi:hypothetical protein [Actinoplanes sp. RD1]|uniref:hypothetical protein n=1 Tax=Actinoplanes sp. RD1 TaxID=3064538 RepID=UPI002740F549|nr:hypothetical protein [Actinoplanes sp. RD1]